jgi:hypothetical protein
MARRLLMFGIVATVLALVGCGSSKKVASTRSVTTPQVSAPKIPLTKQVLARSELPQIVRPAGVRSSRSVQGLVRGLDPLFEPRVLARRFRTTGFRSAAVENIAAAVPNDPATGGFSAVVALGSGSGAADQVKFLHARTLSRCPDVKICDVFWKPFDVPGIPGAAGSVRWRKVDTKNGPSFQQYFIFFSLGPNGYGEMIGAPYGSLSQDQFVSGVTALYNRLRLG